MAFESQMKLYVDTKLVDCFGKLGSKWNKKPYSSYRSLIAEGAPWGIKDENIEVTRSIQNTPKRKKHAGT